MTAVQIAVVSMVVAVGGIWYGVQALTGNGLAGWSFGIAFGWFVYQVVLALQKMVDKK